MSFYEKLASLLNEYRNDKSLIDHIEEIDMVNYKYTKLNIKLYKKLNARHFINSNELAQIFRTKKEGDIIIYVEKADRYLVFDSVEKYKEFILSVIDDFDEKDLIRYQILFSDDKQKAIFLYQEGIDEDSLKKHINDCFGKESIFCHNSKYDCGQVTINNEINRFEDSLPLFEKLYRHIYAKEPQMVNHVRQVVRDINPDIEQGYIFSQIPGVSTDTNTITKMLGSIHANIVNINIVTNINNVNNANNINNINNDNSVQNWIHNNPPDINTPTGLYYDLYKRSNPNAKPKTLHEFTDIMKAEGYRQKRKGSSNIWTKT